MVSNCRLTSQPYYTRHLPRKEERLLVHDRRIACGRTLWLRYGAAEIVRDTVHRLGVKEADIRSTLRCELLRQPAALLLRLSVPARDRRGTWAS